MTTVLVTGGANRIGREVCLKLASQGYGVIIHYHASVVEAANTRSACIELGASFCETIQGDLTDANVRGTLIAGLEARFGPINLLVNNASIFKFDDAATFSAAAFNDHLQTNYIAPVELTMSLHKVASASASKAPRHVVTLLDQKVLNLNPDFMSYTLAKIASHGSIRYLAQCCAPILRVNAVAPGVTLLSGEMTDTQFKTAHQIAALGQSSTLDDVASAILFLDQSRAVTGQTLLVDGGQHLVPRRRDVAFNE